MVIKWVSKVLNSLSARAIVQRLDKRKLQHELDTHRLFLLTSYRARQQDGVQLGADVAEELAAQAEKLQFEGMRAAVASSLQQQLLSLSTALHTALQRQGDPTPAARSLAVTAQQQRRQQELFKQQQQQQQQGQPVRGRGLAFAFGSAQSGAAQQQQPPGSGSGSSGGSEGAAAAAAALSAAQVSAAFREEAGFTLQVAPSCISHSEAGDGLWVDGRAGVGQVVALYPGVCYTPMQYRQIPGYPKIDRGNPYFIGRFDGVLLDAKPWGHGLQRLPESFSATGGSSSGSGSIGWPAQPRNGSEAALALVEGRQPLALGHFANHPPAGTAPNVMVAAVDFKAPEDAPHLRAYIPNVLYHDAEQEERQRELDAEQGREQQPQGAVSAGETVTALALVATRDLEDEELFLNYRLSPHVSPPDWYTPVDAEEDRRRWA